MNNSVSRKIAPSFLWLGRIGLILQTILGFVPILVIVTYLFWQQRQQEIGGIAFGLTLAIACLLMLMFSIYWCFRYTTIANRITKTDPNLTHNAILRNLQFGLFTNIGIMAIAVLISFLRVGELTIKLLTLPQGGTVITPNQLGTTLAVPGTLITPSNLIAIQAMINVIAAGLVGVVIAVILLLRIRQSS
ncbi:MAG: DUF3611 family protein [Microcystaceae cyanobacterium]